MAAFSGFLQTLLTSLNMNTVNITSYKALITREERNKLNKHKSVIIWFTGLSGSGKSTLAHTLEKELHHLNCNTFVLDGDNVRFGLSSDLGFSDKDRKENIRRIGEVSKLMMEAGIIVMTALISPFRRDRDFVRNLVPAGDFIEVYCNSSNEVCESRDVKGLYKKARSGKIENFTGIDSPYEKPINPELEIDTENEKLENSVKKILDCLKLKGIIFEFA